jgi:nucleoside-diphosphate-sugar epimerase
LTSERFTKRVSFSYKKENFIFMKTVLVTGSTGFVGRHLLPVLQQRDWQITAAVRQDWQHSQATSIKTIITGEIDANTDWSEALQGIETVIHLAGRAHILHESTSNPEAEFFRVNTQGTVNLVKQSIAASVKHFVFISSIHAMTTSSDRILTESSVCQPKTSYGRSKLKAEEALIAKVKDSSMTWTILRPTLVYGTGNLGNMERLVKLVRSGLPLPFGSIHNRRSFIYVGNLVDAIVTCLTHPQAVNQRFLVSDDRDLSTPQLVHLIARQMNKPVYLLPIPLSLLGVLGEMGNKVESLLKRSMILNTSNLDRLFGSLFVDSSHIQKTLNWQPPFTIEQGLELTIKT